MVIIMKYLDYFREICKIPHGSGNEKAIVEYIINFSENRKLHYYVDEYYNVLVVKPATQGYESVEPILLQAHTDMVCEKNSDVTHDFVNDGIKVIEKDGFISADGTTLGADDGIGVALMLAILDDETLQHPLLECLFTTQEEIGLIGAKMFDYTLIKSRKLINLDAEKEGEAIISSSAGSIAKLRKAYETVPAMITNKTINIQVVGLAGGHSGADIHLENGNANIIMGRILNRLYVECPFNLVSINGGLKSNAIPRECEAIVHVMDYEQTINIIKNIEIEIKSELNDSDKNFKVKIKKSKATDVMTYKSTSVIITAIMLALNGVLSTDDRTSLVESSSNLGVIHQIDDVVEFICDIRATKESVIDFICEKYDRLAYITGMMIEHMSRYPGWEYNPNSTLKENYNTAYMELFGREPVITGIHAGLECGLIISKLSDKEIDAIAIGPNVYGAHTPDEKLDIESCKKVWTILLKLLEMVDK